MAFKKRNKALPGLKSFFKRGPMLHESFMNHEHPHKETEAVSNVYDSEYGNVQMHPDLQANIKQYMNKPSTSSTSKNETPATSEKSEEKSKKPMVQKLMEKTAKKLLSYNPTKNKTTKAAIKNVSKFTKLANVAGLMLDPVSVAEDSSLYTYKIDPETGLQAAYHNHGPNAGQKVEFNFPDS